MKMAHPSTRLSSQLLRSTHTFCKSSSLAAKLIPKSCRHENCKDLTLGLPYQNCQVKSATYLQSRHFRTTVYASNKKKKKLDPSKFGEGKGKKIVEVEKAMTVASLAEAMGVRRDHVYDAMELRSDMKRFKPDTILNFDVIRDIIKKSDMLYTFKHEEKIIEKKSLDAVRRPPCDPALLKPRSPVVTIMGHVDHGKTTLLDYLRKTSVAEGEAGGITQHIGAFSVALKDGQKITFLDTPGHAAFSAMRSRGAHVTDIVVLVVAADDGVMEQTRESIRFAEEAGVPMIVAINKCDKPASNPEQTKRELLGHGIQLEDFGGEVQAVEISALKGINIDVLGESIIAQAEVMELKADTTGIVEANVIESKVDRGKGAVATVIIERGTLKKGSILVAGKSMCKVRNMYNEHGQQINEAPPSTPVEVTGWKEIPGAGELILEVESEKRAKEVIDWRKEAEQDERSKQDAIIVQKKAEEQRKAHTEKRKVNSLLSWREIRMRHSAERFSREKENVKSEHPELNIVLKGDVDGSVEAILDALSTYDSDQCKLDILHCGVGIVSEKDVEIAKTFDGIVVGFNVAVSGVTQTLADKLGVQILKHSIIYKLIDDLKEELNSRLPPVEEISVLGEATVMQPFTVSVGKRKVEVAGCRVNKGSLNISGEFKLVRNQETIHEGQLTSLKHHKDDVKSVKKDMECGLSFKENLEFKNGDTIICYETSHIPQTIDWDLGF
ncbi:translation initiation factor IF-2, mitochondrial-like [Anneissia japonica]|uniref:translation initiation factor IF-2, mitochondrial-like n=1 Tax=Anneissia japonica TaxID=1529436 RepID=UPI0014255BF1|nr:translation initiation factor IF-2, mitochondrial-like [Anneissia japonica]XP_033096533.1 translation initiation factor IF-2, mitochondrial-like [Anneissia japonica]